MSWRSCDLKLNDLLELSKVYAPEYNMAELHDRVLVFDVMPDGWETKAILDATSVDESSVDESPVTASNEENEVNNEEQTQSNDPASEVSEEEESNEIKQNIAADIETGSTSAQDSAPQELNKEFLTRSPPPKKKKTLRNILSDAQIPDADTKLTDTSARKTEWNTLWGNLSTSRIVCCQQDEKTLVATDENQLAESSSSSAENRELSKTDVLRQHKIFVHSSWLAVQSKYFRSLFYSGMKESNSNEVHVKVSESEEATHLKLLEAIYKADILNNASVEELLAVLELADKYDVKFVFKKCKYVLQTRVNTVDVCKQVMHVIKEKHSFEDVEDLATTMQVRMGNTYSPIENHWQTQNFTSLSQPFVQYLLASSDLLTRCENTVFHALMHWMETNNVDPTSLGHDSGLLKAVRFEKLTIDYLYNVVRVHPIATKMPGFQDLMLKGMTYHALSPELKSRLGEVTPRLRKDLEGNVPQYTWNIPKTKLLIYSASISVDSEIFWLCGYKAMIKITLSSCTLEFYTVRIHLSLLDLTFKSYVPLSWKIESYGILSIKAVKHTNYVNGSSNFSYNWPNSEITADLQVDRMRENVCFQIIANGL